MVNYNSSYNSKYCFYFYLLAINSLGRWRMRELKYNLHGLLQLAELGVDVGKIKTIEEYRSLVWAMLY